MLRRRVAMGAVLVALGAGAFGFSRLKLYVAESPAFCAHCHKTSPEFSAWTRGQHRGTACQSCHHSTPEQGLAMLRAFVIEGAPDKPRKHAQVEVGSCAACHLSHDKNWPQVGASRGHRIHAIEKKISCVKCHASGIHRFEPAAASCRECHGPHAVNVDGMHEVHCFACHNFTGAELTPTRKDCLGCHRARGVLPSRFPEDAPMQFACAACHKPHVEGDQLVACSSGSCHAEILTTGLHREEGHHRCGECHRAHDWKSEREDCLRCHKGMASHHGDKACEDCHPFRAPRQPD